MSRRRRRRKVTAVAPCTRCRCWAENADRLSGDIPHGNGVMHVNDVVLCLDCTALMERGDPKFDQGWSGQR